MKEKEKANELFETFYYLCSDIPENDHEYRSKKCALMCVDEIMLSYVKPLKDGQIDRDNLYFIDKYWQQVKEEIKKL